MTQRAEIEWDPSGAPRSARFDDVYFSRTGGLEESRAVFLAGCGLPEAWRGRRRFTVGELGFGSGLNILALLELWGRSREPGQRLSIFSIEAFPMRPQDAARALGAWPELCELARPLLEAWPQARGFHRIDFEGLDASLDLAVLEAAEALEAWTGAADAWFLDGFSPSRNPEMWREQVLAGIARRSAPGARAATFTVAGAVRRGLNAVGFETAKRPGFGGKAERLEARMAGEPAASPGPPTVAVVGAGIAGAALASAFRAAGLQAVVLDAEGPGAGASGNPAALVTPRLDAGGGAPAQLHAQAFARAVALYGRDCPEALIARGALQLETAPRDAARFDRLAQMELFEEGALERLDAAAAGSRLGEDADAGALWIRDALVLEPRPVLAAWLGDAARRDSRVAGLERSGPGWRLTGADGTALAEADVVVLAAGHLCGALWPGAGLEPVRGQASFAPWTDPPTAAAWGGYVIPTREGLLFGATHERGDASGDMRDGDHGRNLETLARKRPKLAAALAGSALEGRAAVRASTADRLPIAGAVAGADGLYVLSGLGGRGFCLAPLLAEHIAALVAGAPSPLPASLAAAVDPCRFRSRSGAPAQSGPAQEERVP
jgi:tRNA 5-methylaminomethyl-2-thiouridine biosynthesis bifunctional protein